MSTTAPAFAGFRPEAIQFLADLAEHNDRAWFQPRKADYERLLKEPMEALVVALADRFAPAGSRSWPTRSARRSGSTATPGSAGTSRPTRPTSPRASGGSRTPAGRGEQADREPHGNGGYFNFQPGEMYVGGGMWMPEKPRLDAFRRAIVDEPARVRAPPSRIRASRPGSAAASSHEELKRMPPGYPADHPMADLFRWKDVVFGRRLSDAEVCSADLPDRLADGFAAALPVFRFLATLR